MKALCNEAGRRWFIVEIVVLLFTLILFFSTVLFTDKLPGGQVLIFNDPLTQFIPWFHFAKESIGAGSLPLWNPYQACGVPHIANMQSAFFYPLNLFVYLLPWKWGLTLLYFFKLFFIGLASYLYLRVLNLTYSVSILASIALTYSTFNMLYLYWPQTNTSLFLPLGLFSIELIIQNPARFKGYLILSISLIIALFGGHPEMLFYITFFILCYALTRIYTQYHLHKESLFIFLKILLIIIISIGISSIQLLPFLEYLHYSTAYNTLKGSANVKYLLPQMFYFSMFQDFYGILYKGPIFVTFLLGEIPKGIVLTPDLILKYVRLPGMIGHINITFYFLGIIGLLKLYKNKLVLFFLAMFIFGIFASFNVPLIHKIITLLPAFDIGWNSYMFALSSWCFVLIGAIALDQIFKDTIERTIINKALGILIIILFVFTVYFAHYYTELLPKNITPFLYTGIGINVLTIIFLIIISFYSLKIKNKIYTSILLGIIIFSEAGVPWIFYEKVMTKADFYPSDKIIDFIKQQNKPFRVAMLKEKGRDEMFNGNMNTFYDIEGLTNYDVMGVKWYDKIYPNKPDPRFLNFTNVKYIIAPQNDLIEKTDLQILNLKSVMTTNRYTLFENPSAFNRAFLVYNYYAAKDDEDDENILYDHLNELNNTAVIFNKEAKYATFTSHNNSGNGSVLFSIYKPDYIKMYISTSSPALLVISNAYFPGWHAYVDGKRNVVIRTDYAFQGVFLKEGKHIVILRYMPSSFKIGIFITLVSVIILIIIYRLMFKKYRKTGINRLTENGEFINSK
ncbi:MAG: YfhO family protein [Brevinematia bacterium]